MTAPAAQRVHKDTAGKKQLAKKERRKKSALDIMAEYSLSGFLENEPDLYSVSDINVRHR